MKRNELVWVCGVCAQGAGAARSRLVDARGPTFALAAVISANGGPGGPGGGSAGGGGYITVAPLGGAGKAARLDVARLLQVRACVRACVCVCMRACVLACVSRPRQRRTRPAAAQ